MLSLYSAAGFAAADFAVLHCCHLHLGGPASLRLRCLLALQRVDWFAVELSITITVAMLMLTPLAVKWSGFSQL